MGTVIAMLLQAEHRDWIEWIIEVIELVLAARTEIVLSTDEPNGAMDDSDTEDYGRVRNFSGPSKAAQEKFEQYGESLWVQRRVAGSCQMSMAVPRNERLHWPKMPTFG